MFKNIWQCVNAVGIFNRITKLQPCGMQRIKLWEWQRKSDYAGCNCTKRIRRRAIMMCFQRWNKILAATNLEITRQTETSVAPWQITQIKGSSSTRNSRFSLADWVRIRKVNIYYVKTFPSPFLIAWIFQSKAFRNDVFCFISVGSIKSMSNNGRKYS